MLRLFGDSEAIACVLRMVRSCRSKRLDFALWRYVTNPSSSSNRVWQFPALSLKRLHVLSATKLKNALGFSEEHLYANAATSLTSFSPLQTYSNLHSSPPSRDVHFDLQLL